MAKGSGFLPGKSVYNHKPDIVSRFHVLAPRVAETDNEAKGRLRSGDHTGGKRMGVRGA